MFTSREPDFFLGHWRVRPQLSILEGPDGETVALEPKAMETLVCLARAPGKVMRRDRIIASVWGESFITEGALTQAIWQLRQALGDDPREPRFIQTVPRRGYRLVARVTRLESPMKKGEHTVGPYCVGEKLGGGAMGIVHKAEDTRLRRTVALKFLAPELARDADAQARFLREARAASALDHPHICTIHDIGESEDGETYLAMAYYQGETLKKRLERSSLPVDEALEIAAQIAEGLAAAHARGIVHRDLKPANVFLTSDGSVKLLDFGLAKLTDTTLVTVAGRPLGTPAYMAPEQARGEPVDHRADLWALGIILYQMLSGELPFAGESSNAILYAIVHEEPQPLAEGIVLPLGVAELLAGLLRKDPAQRYSDSEALPAALRGGEAPGISKTDSVAAPVQRRMTPPFWIATGAGVAVAIVAGWWLMVGRAPPPPDNPTITPITTDGGWKERPDLSPDGEKVAYEWQGPGSRNRHIYIKLLGVDASPVRLTDHGATEASPVWSPDGREIAFVRLEGENGAVYVRPWLGGRERKVADLVGPVWLADCFLPSLSWSSDGTWLALAEQSARGVPTRIMALSLDTAEKRPLTFPPQESQGDFYPKFSPDGSRIVFARGATGGWAGLDLWVRQLAGGSARRLTSGQYEEFSGISWMPDGREIVYGVGAGWSAGSKVFRLNLAGEGPRPVEGLHARAVAFSVRNTRMVYLDVLSRPGDIWKSPGRSGISSGLQPRKFLASNAHDQSPAISPDGTKIAFMSYRSGTANIWIAAGDGSDPRQLTQCSSHCGTPNWSPDGSLIVFDSMESGNWDLYVVDAEGGTPRQVTIDPSDDGTPTWSRDGRRLYFHSDRTGRDEIWKINAEGGEARQVTRNGGFYARESWDGRHLYYADVLQGSRIWRVPVSGGEEVEVLPGPIPYFGNWELSRTGIYYATASWVSDESAPFTGSIHFFDFESQQTTDLVRRDEVHSLGSLSVSPDEKWLLFAVNYPPDTDLVLAENFR